MGKVNFKSLHLYGKPMQFSLPLAATDLGIKEYPLKEVADKPRVRGAEREALIQLRVIMELTKNVENQCEGRAKKVKGLWRNVRLLRSLTERILWDMLQTVPDDALEGVVTNIGSAGWATGANKATHHEKRFADFGVWVSFNQFGVIFDALHDHCLTCMKDKSEEGACPLRKTLDAIGCDLEHDYGCAYKEVM